MSPSLATDRKNADALGHRARRHYWLAPRSDDAVGAGSLGLDAGEVAAVEGPLTRYDFAVAGWRGSTSTTSIQLMSYRRWRIARWGRKDRN